MSDLGIFLVDPIEDSLIRGLVEAALYSCFLVMFISLTQPFGAEVKGISERLVDAGKVVLAGHKNLVHVISVEFTTRIVHLELTLSNAVEHARGWVATKMGLVDIFGTAPPNLGHQLWSSYKISGLIGDFNVTPRNVK